MKVIINETELNIINYKDFYDYNINELIIKFNKTDIEDEAVLKTLFKSNTGDIIITNDNESIITYYGYIQYVKFTEDDDTYMVYCGALPKTEKKVAELTSIINAQNEKINSLNNDILSMTSAITEGVNEV